MPAPPVYMNQNDVYANAYRLLLTIEAEIENLPIDADDFAAAGLEITPDRMQQNIDAVRQHASTRKELIALLVRAEEGFDLSDDPVAEDVHRLDRLVQEWGVKAVVPIQTRPHCVKTHRELLSAVVEWDKPAARKAEEEQEDEGVGPRDETIETMDLVPRIGSSAAAADGKRKLERKFAKDFDPDDKPVFKRVKKWMDRLGLV